jgi:hypothetical protein
MLEQLCFMWEKRKDLKLTLIFFIVPPAPVTLKVILMPMPVGYKYNSQLTGELSNIANQGYQNG